MDKSAEIRKIQEVIDELNDIVEERIRAEERLKVALQALEEFGVTTLEKAREECARLEKEIKELGLELEEEFDDFMQDYRELMDHA